MFRKLERTWSHNDINYIPRFKEVFPELNKISSEDMADRMIELNLDFYTETKTPVSVWMRLTLPFALIFMLIMLIGMPFNFFLTGKWGYSLGKKNRVYNWFKALKLS